jgi:hypothetical protein
MFNVLKLVVLKNNPEYTHSINYGVMIFNEIHMFCFFGEGFMILYRSLSLYLLNIINLISYIYDIINLISLYSLSKY